MQTDFHHAATYTIARCAGFPREQAEVIAYAAQYVDDATNAGLIEFEEGALYERTASAHKMLDYKNFDELANHKVWLPFHFLPGNASLPPGEIPAGKFIERLICRPGNVSHVAEEMVRLAIAERRQAYGLHRFGVTMHVYADTWAHQGFAGVLHKINRASEFSFEHAHEVANGWKAWMERIKARFVATASPPLGHGEAASAPDQPYLVWSYTNGRGERIERNNPRDFRTAAEYMCRKMRGYLAGDYKTQHAGLAMADAKVIGEIIDLESDDAEVRYQAWVTAVEAGRFSFGKEVFPTYIAKGEGSWKYHALGTTKEHDSGEERYRYDPSFLTSDWKRFHDGLSRHRFAMLHEVLPRYGICAA
jgi:hypothetical protein